MRRRVLHLAAAAAALPVLAGAVPKQDRVARAALGERVLAEFCLSCHTLDDPRQNALVPKLRASKLWSTEDAAYRNIGRLKEINRAMLVQFSGTDEERRALASTLVRLATDAPR
jgi:mono/diheme cytochrome c family protein